MIKYQRGDRIITKLTKQSGVIVRVDDLARANYQRLYVRCNRRVIIVDSDMVEIDKPTGMLTYPQIMELAQRRANVDKRTYCVVFCSVTGYNIMTPEKAARNKVKVVSEVTPDKHWKDKPI